MANLNYLYPEDQRQQAFVQHQSGTLVALAGPGTGKTYSLLLRIKELTENRHIDGKHICYLTFNREIVGAFRDDLRSNYLGTAPPLIASTLHSLACRLIKNKGHKIQLAGYLHILNLCDAGDKVASVAVSDMISTFPQGTPIRTPRIMRRCLGVLKNDWQKGGSAGHLTGDDASVRVAYQAYSRALKLLDWDEVVPLAIALYSDEDNRPDWIKEYQHLLIDEYQDFNIAEQIFLDLISESVASRVVVGDDDQSIYSGRGASPEGIRALVKDPNVNSISLVICRRRPPEQIAEAVNRFLSFMHASPRLLEAAKPGGAVEIKSFMSAKAEVDDLAQYIKGILSQIDEDTSPNDGVVCLFPQKKVLQQYRAEFEKRELKCKCRDSSDLSDDKVWVRILGRLAFQGNQLFLERLVLDRFQDFKPRHKKEVVTALLNGYASVSLALASIKHNRGWKEPTLTAISEYNAFIESLTSRHPTRVALCIDSVLPNGRRCDPSYVDDFLAAVTTDETMLEEALDILIDRIYSDGDEEGDEAEFEPAVELLTLHSSKGLTRRYVILPGLEHYWLPGDAIGNDLEERKRLFLVGITRATESLLITYPRSRAKGDSLNLRLPGCLRLSEFASHLGVPVRRL